MNTKMLKTGILLLAVSLCFAFVVIHFSNKNQYKKVVGNLVFEQSFNNAANIDKITIKTDRSETTMILDDKFWKIKEADFYYANLLLSNELFININNSRYHSKIEFTQENIEANDLVNPEEGGKSHYGKILTVYTKGDIKQNSFIVGKVTDNGLYSFIRPLDKNEIWMVTGRYTLPNYTFSWLQQPLLELSKNSVSAVSTTMDGQTIEADRTEFYNSFYKKDGQKAYVNALLDEFEYLSFETAASAQNFDETKYPNQKKIVLETFSGFIANLTILNDNKDYWIKLHLSTTSLPTAGISDYIKDKSFLYDGWFFKLPQQKGRFLYSYQIR